MQKRGKNPATPSVKVHTAPAQKLLIRQELPDAKEENGILSKNSALQNNAKSVAFCSFCAFAEKNAVFFGKTRSQRRFGT